jgi:hypothetical protein
MGSQIITLYILMDLFIFLLTKNKESLGNSLLLGMPLCEIALSYVVFLKP